MQYLPEGVLQKCWDKLNYSDYSSLLERHVSESLTSQGQGFLLNTEDLNQKISRSTLSLRFYVIAVIPKSSLSYGN